MSVTAPHLVDHAFVQRNLLFVFAAVPVLALSLIHIFPADVGSAPLEDSGHADPLHRPEARIVGRQVEVRQQVAARIEHRLLHPAHRNFGRIDARRRGQRRQGSRCLPDLQHDGLQARGAIDEVGYRNRFFGYEQPRKSCGNHDAQRKTV